MRDHALGKNPDLDNFLINWIRLLEAYQVRQDHLPVARLATSTCAWDPRACADREYMRAPWCPD